MKTFKSILIIVIGLALSAVVLRSVKTKNNPTPVGPATSDTSNGIDLSPEVNAKQLCYQWNTPAGDKALLSMDIRGENVIGEFNWLPAEKDKKTGIFTGTVTPLDQKTMSRTANVFWDTNGEGMKVTEELKIIFGEGMANVGFGEMKDRGDGVYVYANPDKLSYEPSLSQTDCGDNAMD